MVTIREMRLSEHWFLRAMLYEAIYVPPGETPLAPAVIDEPSLAKYFADFVRPGDAAFVAFESDQLIGAVWSRRFALHDPGYGFVDEHTPELSIAVKAESRRNGLGTRMLELLIHRLESDGCKEGLSQRGLSQPCKRLIFSARFWDRCAGRNVVYNGQGS